MYQQSHQEESLIYNKNIPRDNAKIILQTNRIPLFLKFFLFFLF